MLRISAWTTDGLTNIHQVNNFKTAENGWQCLKVVAWLLKLEDRLLKLFVSAGGGSCSWGKKKEVCGGVEEVVAVGEEEVTEEGWRWLLGKKKSPKLESRRREGLDSNHGEELRFHGEPPPCTNSLPHIIVILIYSSTKSFFQDFRIHCKAWMPYIQF
ncbi:hypothetical protein L1987_80665 [Smallanthus sonchifolius]|uniref:Uncharacterized protein n=1 Tax=Smallanthus sonchifolius TaxID=185202 RepID=A0ACB8YNB4_9ASTR|nr:hypothetical protein L1987_80665 [Smallanthus sonchifolius]